MSDPYFREREDDDQKQNDEIAKAYKWSEEATVQEIIHRSLQEKKEKRQKRKHKKEVEKEKAEMLMRSEIGGFEEEEQLQQAIMMSLEDGEASNASSIPKYREKKEDFEKIFNSTFENLSIQNEKPSRRGAGKTHPRHQTQAPSRTSRLETKSRVEHPRFPQRKPPSHPRVKIPMPSIPLNEDEDEDLARAIQLSLQDSKPLPPITPQASTIPEEKEHIRLRQEQDEEFLESLLKDQQKEQEKQEEILKQQNQEKVKIDQKMNRQSKISQLKNEIPPEPSDSDGNVFKVRVRMPHGDILTRKFISNQPISTLKDFVLLEGLLHQEDFSDRFQLVIPFPRQELADLQKTFQDYQLKNATVYVEWQDDEETSQN